MLKLALRNFLRHWTRYQVLLTIVVLGAALSIVLLGVGQSLSDSLEAKAKLYFGGDVAVVGTPGSETHLLTDPGAVDAAVRAAGVHPQALNLRTVSYNRETVLFHSTNNLKQRRLIGLDAQREASALATMDFDEGDATALAAGSSLVISRVTADKLGVRVGDEVTLLTDTVRGAKNTLRLTVCGIFHDTSFFGYSSYLSQKTLNQALDLPPDAATEVGLDLGPGVSADGVAQAVSVALGPGVDASVVTLQARLAQIQNVLDALTTVIGVLTLIFLAITALGVANTFRSVLVERTREIGVMRALGMGRGQLMGLVVAEVAWLAVIGGLVGATLGLGAWVGLTAVDWGNHPLATMFLHRGRLVWAFPWVADLGFFGALVAFGVLGALGAAYKAAHWRPLDALRFHT